MSVLRLIRREVNHCSWFSVTNLRMFFVWNFLKKHPMYWQDEALWWSHIKCIDEHRGIILIMISSLFWGKFVGNFQSLKQEFNLIVRSRLLREPFSLSRIYPGLHFMDPVVLLPFHKCKLLRPTMNQINQATSSHCISLIGLSLSIFVLFSHLRQWPPWILSLKTFWPKFHQIMTILNWNVKNILLLLLLLLIHLLILTLPTLSTLGRSQPEYTSVVRNYIESTDANILERFQQKFAVLWITAFPASPV